MNKKEIKTVPNNELLIEYIKTYSLYDVNTVLRRGTTNAYKHLQDLEEELIKRNIFTQEDIRQLNL